MKLRTWCIRSGQILAKPVLVFTGFLVFLTIFNPATIKAENGRGGITIRHENVPIQKVFQSIEKQSGYRFFYNETLLQGAVKVTLNLQHVSLQEALDACFRNQPLSYAIVDKTIIVKRRPEQQPLAPIPAAVSFTTPARGKLIAVRGKVTSNNIPVAGASIMIKGTDNGASTDKDGVFTLAEVDEDAILIISSVSHQSQEIKLNGKTFISIDLDKKSDDLDEAMVVAYNTTTRRMNTGAVTVIKGEEIQNLPNRSIDKSLQGLVPGLYITSGTGQPGGGVSNFVLRGIATNAASQNFSTVRNPLIVIDGVPVTQETSQIVNRKLVNDYTTATNNPLAQLNSSDIESISVLKDAAAIALYGAKSSNGVILITTKKGKTGKTRFNFRHQTDLAMLPKVPDMLNQEQYLDLLYETYKNTPRVISGVSTPWTDADILADLKLKFPTRSDGSFYPATDWVNELYHKTAATISNELSMSGGSEKTNFYLNLEWTKQDGILKKTGYDRKSIRLNFEHRPTAWLKLGTRTTLSYNLQDYGMSGYNGNNNTNAGLSVMRISPLDPVRLENGDYNLTFKEGGISQNLPNPAAQLAWNINRNTAFRGLSKLYGEISFLRYFKLSANLGIDFTQTESKEKADPRLIDPGIGTTGGRIEDQSTRRANLISTNMVTYNQTFGKYHTVNFLLGQEAQVLTTKSLDIAVTNLSNPYYDQITSPGVTVFSNYGVSNKETLLSYFSQLNYDFKNRYFLTGSIRRDGSSRFGEDKRFGTYWSIGSGWLISAEPFMQSINHFINYLKIRGSIGAAGNAGAIDQFTPYSRMQAGTYLGNIAVSPTGVGNPDVKWENTFSWDAGIETRLFQERINITADIYTRTTKNLIYEFPIPFNTGFATILGNLGSMRNNGVELSISADVIKNKNFRWNINANWSTNNNILVKANSPDPSAQYVAYNQEGKSFNSFYLIQWAGVDPATGSPQWVDSTGKISSNYKAAKRVFVGKVQPDGFGAITNTISYKGVELSAMLYYQYGSQIYVPYTAVGAGDGYLPYANQSTEALNHWQNADDNAANPKPVLNNPQNGSNSFSTRYLYNADFIRLQNISLGFQFPNKLTDRLHISTMKIYVQGNNLHTWTRNNGLDPSNSSVYGSADYAYPIQRAYSVGLNVGF